VRLGPVAFAKLPHIYDIAIENKTFGFDRFEVAQKFFGMTAVGAQVDIRNDHQFYFTFSFLAQREVFRCPKIVIQKLPRIKMNVMRMLLRLRHK
jgi:hypothetical protein